MPVTVTGQRVYGAGFDGVVTSPRGLVSAAAPPGSVSGSSQSFTDGRYVTTTNVGYAPSGPLPAADRSSVSSIRNPVVPVIGQP